MDIKHELKVLIVKEGMNFKSFADFVSQKTGRKYSPQNLFNKLSKKTLRAEEFATFCDILGYDIEFKKRS